MALLGQLFSVISTAQPMQLDSSAGPDAPDDRADIMEDVANSWLRTAGLVAVAGRTGHPAFQAALARAHWLQHLGPSLGQLRAQSEIDPRLIEALESLLV